METTTEDKQDKQKLKKPRRKRKADEIEREKKLKNLRKIVNQNLQKGECLKLITVRIDDHIYDSNLGPSLVKSLAESNVKCTKYSQIIPNTITWLREVQFVEEDTEEPQISTVSVEESELLLILYWDKIVEMVSKKSLTSYIMEQKILIPDKKITLLLHGLRGYFRHLKNLKNQQMQENVAGASRRSKKKSMYDDAPKISLMDLEYPLVELQILATVNNVMIETQADLNMYVFQCSKAIAETPLKMEKRQHEEINNFIQGSNRDTVRVDKDGNGIQRAWQEQLMQFSLASLETVQAIISKYPTPNSLLTEYDKLPPEEGERLLQDLLVRRTAGPLAHQRKVGPEMSKKIYNFFTSQDGNALIAPNE